MATRLHLKVRTEDAERYADMIRYLGYARRTHLTGDITDFTPETAEPFKQNWGGSKVTVHRFQEDGYTYFRQPSIFNNHWATGGHERWASFGVNSEIVRR
jgi:hypothetical protein